MLGKDLVSIADLSAEDLHRLLDLAATIKAEAKKLAFSKTKTKALV